VVQIQKPLLVCLQETKISDFSRPLITACLGSDYSSNFWFLPADDTREESLSVEMWAFNSLM
jgi:hypothetical protein